jgi:hypothetical protein
MITTRLQNLLIGHLYWLVSLKLSIYDDDDDDSTKRHARTDLQKVFAAPKGSHLLPNTETTDGKHALSNKLRRRLDGLLDLLVYAVAVWYQ